MDMFFERASSMPPNVTRLGTTPAIRKRDRNAPEAPVIALVNNMPDSALAATERQFLRLIRNSLGDTADVRLYHIPSLPRGDDATAQLAERYLPVEALYQAPVDALIVTGNEPRAAHLDDEPYWADFAALVDWARGNTQTALWSCLAAHGAVLHLDGVTRHRLKQKKSGVVACSVDRGGSLGLPSALSICHSRMNELRPDELEAKGYRILSEAPGGIVDCFWKKAGSAFLFLQGHPEYDADSLMREYRRDVGRFLNGQRDQYPEIPEHYFDNDTVIRMENYRTRAERTRDLRLFENFPAAGLRDGLEDRLAASARAVFDAWLAPVRTIAGVN